MLGVEGRKHERIISKCSGEYRETAKDAGDNLGKRQQRCSCSKHMLWSSALPQMKLVVTSCGASDFAARLLPYMVCVCTMHAYVYMSM